MEEHRAKATMVFHRPRSGGSMGKIVPKGDFFHRFAAWRRRGVEAQIFNSFRTSKKFRMLNKFQMPRFCQTVVIPSAFYYLILKNLNMSKFRKKPVEIEAIQFTRINWGDVKAFTNETAHSLGVEKPLNGIATCIIPTLEGQHIATEGDWIIKGIKGEFYPCKPDIFGATYEAVL